MWRFHKQDIQSKDQNCNDIKIYCIVYILSSIKVALYEKQQKQWFGKQSTDKQKETAKKWLFCHKRIYVQLEQRLLTCSPQTISNLSYYSIYDSALDFQSRLIAMHESQQQRACSSTPGGNLCRTIQHVQYVIYKAFSPSLELC